LLLNVEQVGDEQYEPEELKNSGPRELSFWIASNFREMPQHQQVLLQVCDILLSMSAFRCKDREMLS